MDYHKRISLSHNVSYDLEDKSIYSNGEKYGLRPKAHLLLEYLLANIDVTLSSDLILEKVWDEEEAIGGLHQVTDTISELRKVFNEAGLNSTRIIQTQRKIGYRISSDEIAESSQHVKDLFKVSNHELEINDYNGNVPLKDLFKECSDLLVCCCPDIPGAIQTKEKSDGIHVEYDFSNSATPEFISVVYQFFNNVNLNRYIEENPALKLSFLFNNPEETIKAFDLEFQAEPNRVFGKPYTTEMFNAAGFVFSLPIAHFAKYRKDLSQLHNIAIVVRRDSFMEQRGSFEISHIKIS